MLDGFLVRITTWMRNHYLLTLSAASTFLFVAGLKPFHLGLWFQSEPVTLAFFIFGLGMALALLVMRKEHPALLLLAHHPVMRVLGAMIAWSAGAALFTDFTMRSFFGPAETGIGILAFLSLLMLVAGGYLAWQREESRPLLATTAAIAGVVSVGLQRIATSKDWQPANWPDFGAFIAIFVMMLLLAYPPRIEKKHVLVATGVGALITLLSSSLSAWLALAVVPALAVVLWAMKARIHSHTQLLRRARQLFIAVALLPLLFTLLTANVGLMRSLHSHVLDAVRADGTKEFEQGSLGTRVLFNNVAFDALLDQPHLLLTGNGWGSFSDLLFAYVFTDGVRLYDDNGQWQVNWFVVTGSAFHSHNSFLEALISTGLIGLALFCLLPVAIIRSLPEDKLLYLGPLWSATFVLSAFWFMMPLALPFMALALAAGFTASKGEERASSLTQQHLKYIGYVAVAALSAGVWIQHDTAQSAHRLIQAVQTRLPEPGDRTMLRDYGRGGNHLWWIAANLSAYINNKIAKGTPGKPDDAAWHGELIAIIEEAVRDRNANDRLRGQYVSMHHDLIALYKEPHWNTLKAQRLPRWKSVVLDTIYAVPTRGDLALIYNLFFYQEIGSKQTAAVNTALANQVLQMADGVLKRNPDDLTALWFSGLVMIRYKEHEQEGLRRLFAVLDRHGDRFVPISQPLRKSIEKYRPKQ